MYNQNSKKVFSLLTMDDDDELLLNFAAPDTSSVAASKNQNVKVLGGRWKDRRKLQLALQGRTKRDNQKPA